MSSKISALPAATQTNNADLITSVQGGVNKKVTRPIFLTANGIEDLNLIGAQSNFVKVFGSGEILIQYLVGQSFTIQQSDTLTLLEVDGSGGVLFLSPTGNNVVIGTGVASLTFLGAGGIQLTNGLTFRIVIDYIPSTPANWSPTTPVELANAIDRIAAAVVGLLGGPIP